jgi:hypothetical protein
VLRSSEARKGRGCSGSGGELGVADSGFDDRLGHLAAFAALGGYAEFLTHSPEGISASKDGFLDLAVGDGFTEADVHGALNCESVMAAKRKGNENQCQQSLSWCCAGVRPEMQRIKG